ncbi:DUF1822 family protein [Pantanalinema rosaneae CENA516]|uniref:DUF1822 family protein n=1 Tax=Pantanalinema rosaneae TaxID=1620701 RepID=UPI003D6DC78C
MINSISAALPRSLDLLTLQEAVIELEIEQCDRAMHLSQSARTEADQWQAYINLLAIEGLEHWLNTHLDPGAIAASQCWILQPSYAHFLSSVSHLEINGFRLCLIVTESIGEEWIAVPRAVFDVPEFTAHFYVLIEVQEEQAQVIVRGCLRHDQWLQMQQVTNVTVDVSWHYSLALDWFDPDFSHLLAWLRFLAPGSLPLPVAIPSIRQQLAPIQAELAQQLPTLDLNQPIAEQLDWKHGSVLLTCPPLLNVLTQLRTNAEPTTIATHIATTLTQLTQQVVNVWYWSHHTIDRLQFPLDWSMPQLLVTPGAMRRTTDKLTIAIADLIQRQRLTIPTQAQYASHRLAQTNLQVGIVTWLLPDADWALLVILVAEPGSTIPVGTRLQVGVTTILTEVVLTSQDLYLYTLLEGNQTEEFVITILLPNALPLTLPPIVCQAGSA